MSRNFAFVWTAVGVAVLATVAAVGGQEQAQPAGEKPAVIALKFHADWCASCRSMGTVFEDLTTVAEDEPVLFTELDLTNRSTRKQAQYLMSLLGLDRVWEQAGSGEKTGFIVLVDVDSRQPVGQLSADQDLKQMKAALLDVVANSRG